MLYADLPAKKVEEPEASVPTAPVHSAKAKRKAALSKANAEGPKGGLLDAFTGPQPTPAEPQPEAAKETPKPAATAAVKPPAPSPEKVSSCTCYVERLARRQLREETVRFQPDGLGQGSVLGGQLPSIIRWNACTVGSELVN